jgi:hypothetical protein
MAKHTIDVEELEIGSISQEVAGSYGEGECKRLVVVVALSRVAGGSTVTFRVEDHKAKVHEGDDLMNAIDAYNKT